MNISDVGRFFAQAALALFLAVAPAQAALVPLDGAPVPIVATFPNGDKFEGLPDGDYVWTFSDGSRAGLRGRVIYYAFPDGSRIDVLNGKYGFIDASGMPTGDVILPEMVISQADQRRLYPSIAMRERTQGTTVITYVIGADGGVSNLQIIKSSGAASLDNASMTLIQSRQFRPFTVAGRAIKSPGRATIIWKIQ